MPRLLSSSRIPIEIRITGQKKDRERAFSGGGGLGGLSGAGILFSDMMNSLVANKCLL
jgi:hypothetical protein